MIVFVGSIVHAVGANRLEILDPGCIGVRPADGSIAFCERLDDDDDDNGNASSSSSSSTTTTSPTPTASLASLAKTHGFSLDTVTRLRSSQFLIPGFIDTHIHAPQYVFTGTGTDLPLLQWLNKYTFPRESGFADTHYARAAYTRAVHRSARCGTTTACYFATIHLEATKTLVDVISRLGQRALVGKVNMDRNSPDYYIETLDDARRDTRAFVDHVLGLRDPRIAPVITPRFVPTCSEEMLRFLGDLAREKDVHVQSHLCESKAEIEWVRQLHPECDSYTQVYHRFGLLGDRCVMAHCVHMTPEERGLIKATGAGVSHCPLSNFAICSGVANVRAMLDEGLKVGLGTDVAGGYSSSILDSLRQAIIASKVVAVRSREDEPDREHHPEPLSYAEAFHLATLGGAHVLGMEDRLGNFIAGKQFDALLIDVDGASWSSGEENGGIFPSVTGDVPQTFIDVFPHDDIESTFEKFLFLGDDRNIAQVWVAGKKLNFTV